MCGASNERIQPRNPEDYRASNDVRGALNATFNMLKDSPEHTVPIGRKLFGVQHYMTAGWCYDEANGRVVEFKAHWLERGLVANFMLNPHRPRRSVQAMSVAHIETGDIGDESRGPLPYRLYFYSPRTNAIDTCQYDDYEADMGAIQGLGGSEMMREQLEQAQSLGEDVLTPETEEQLVYSLFTGCKITGWQPIQD